MRASSSIPRLPVARFAERTLPALLATAARRWPSRRFLRFLEPATGEVREVTFGAFARGAEGAAAALRSAGVGAGDRVLLLAENSPEWPMVALGAQLLRAEPAALFASLAAQPAAAIARRVLPRAVFVSGAAQWVKLAPIVDELAAGGLRAVLTGEPLDPTSMPVGLRSLSLAEVTGSATAATGELERLSAAVGEEDPFLLLFTSGTTGRPKGVRLPQRAIVHALEAGAGSVGTTEVDVGLHFLPFGHVAGHDQFTLALAQGHELVMTARREDLDAALALRPTYLFSVPLVYERIREAVGRKLAALPAPLRSLSRAALAAATRVRVDGSRSIGDRTLRRVADLLVGRAVRHRLGGGVRGLFSGGAPASVELFRFFEGLGLPFVELYGMSETAGMISSNLFSGPRRAGSVGLISPDHEVRLAADDELQIRGPLLLSGYLDAEDDLGAHTDDGFFRTGDLARIDEQGFLFVEGRRKNLMVLSTGKKLSPEPIEQAIATAPSLLGAVLLGEGRPFVAAAVFVAREELARLAALGQDAAAALLPRVRAALASFSDFEIPKRLLVIPGAPEEHPALLTPTLKLRRDVLVEWLGEAVPALFAAVPDPS
jgi:long-chain acyl-CoA synthetase